MACFDQTMNEESNGIDSLSDTYALHTLDSVDVVGLAVAMWFLRLWSAQANGRYRRLKPLHPRHPPDHETKDPESADGHKVDDSLFDDEQQVDRTRDPKRVRSRRSRLAKAWARRDARWFQRYVLPDLLQPPTQKPSARTTGSKRRSKTACAKKAAAQPLPEHRVAVQATCTLPRGPDAFDVAMSALVEPSKRFMRRSIRLRRNHFSLGDGATKAPLHPRPSLVWSQSQRLWNKTMRVVDLDRVGGTGPDTSLRDICLISSLRSLGIPVTCETSGPFRALADGNRFLQPFHRFLMYVPQTDVSNGKFVVWRAVPSESRQAPVGHFFAVTVAGTQALVVDGCRSYSCPVEDVAHGGSVRWYRLEAAISDAAQARVQANRSIGLARRRDALMARTQPATPTAPPAGWTLQQRATWTYNREVALQRRSAHLLRPHPPAEWPLPLVPARPLDFYAWGCELPEVTWLSTLNEHARDKRLTFYQATHRYFVDGKATLGSVTGVVHAFCDHFDSRKAIATMAASRNWPRPGYLIHDLGSELERSFRDLPGSAALLGLWTASPRDEQAICDEAKRLGRTSSNARSLVDLLSLSPTDIERQWEVNRQTAAHEGTFMHWMFEAWINRVPVPEDTDEMRLFLPVMRSLKGLVAYRTEWMIFGEPECLAGSIDFAAKRDDGGMVLFDWKRTRSLRTKYQNRFQKMHGPLSHLDDCAGMHYRLQLNCYKYMIEAYYNERVTSMYVVCTHPDNGSSAFIDEVPHMPHETACLMQYQRDRVREHACLAAEDFVFDPFGGAGSQKELALAAQEVVQAPVDADQDFAALFHEADLSGPPLSSTGQVPSGREAAATDGEQTISVPAAVSDARGAVGGAGSQKEMDFEDILNEALAAQEVVQAPVDADQDFAALFHEADLSGPPLSSTGQVPSGREAAATDGEHTISVPAAVSDARGAAQGHERLDAEDITVTHAPEAQIAMHVGMEADINAGADASQAEELQCDVIPERLKRRRHYPGAASSSQDFDALFAAQRHAATLALQTAPRGMASETMNIQQVRQALVTQAKAFHAEWSQEMVRLVATALATYRLRLLDMWHREHALLIWIIEGDTFLRSHNRTVYVYCSEGAFTALRDSPPEAMFGRVKAALLQLEGCFRLLPLGVKRQDVQLLEAIRHLRMKFDTDHDFFCRCADAAIFCHGDRSAKGAGRGAAELPPFDELEGGLDAGGDGDLVQQQALQAWTIWTAQALSKVGASIQRELLDDRLMTYVSRWCNTPNPQRPGCAYTDTCVLYDVSDGHHLTHVARSPSNNIYVRIPHPLCDPVLEHAQLELLTFYKQTFWCNQYVLECCQAAQALAKRGENIDRLFIGISPGGVGQSLYSMHLHAMFGESATFFDPNVWYNDEELRKQVEAWTGCIVLTGQEAPESSRRLREDLFKKTMSADAIAGRKPYGYSTKMVDLVGWKRLECNALFRFSGVTEENFASILRRSFCWKPKARFFDEDFLKEKYPDAHLDGIFPTRPHLRHFLKSGPAIAAGLVVQHGFELGHSREACLAKIDNWAVLGKDEGLTESVMREACGLRPRPASAGRLKDHAISVLAGNPSQDSGNAASQGNDSWSQLLSHLIDHCLKHNKDGVTTTVFKYLPLPPTLALKGSKDELWAQLI